MGSQEKLKWNKDLRLVFSDVDETVADIYQPATGPMLRELERLLEENIVLFLMSGDGLPSIWDRIIDRIKPDLRKNILVAHCSGAEVFGFDEKGLVSGRPYYSLYEENLGLEQRKEFRRIIGELIAIFRLKTFPTMPKDDFRKLSEADPLAIMLADRNAQITFNMANSVGLTPVQTNALAAVVPMPMGANDLRIPIMEQADLLFQKRNVPITSRLAGNSSIDFAVKGVSKTTAVRWFIGNEGLLIRFGLHSQELAENPRLIEVWGDKYSTTNGGTDRHMSEGLPPEVRSIDFRKENIGELPTGYNIQIWPGRHHLHEGLLEYLQSRH